MSASIPLRAIRSLVTSEHFGFQSRTEDAKRYRPYCFNQGLRKAMSNHGGDEIQELEANRAFNTSRNQINRILESNVSNIMNGEQITRRQLELDFNRSEDGEFPWKEVEALLGEPETIYDLPVRRMVVRFSDEEFMSRWTDMMETAIDADDFPTDWIEEPFFAILESQKPGDSDARENVKEAHEDFYFKPKFKTQKNYDGMDWSIRTLDLMEIWSFRGFVDQPDVISTTYHKDRRFEWTPRLLEQYIINYFDPNQDYTGVLRNSDFASLWRRVYSRDVTSTKHFEWEEEQEWVQVAP